MLNCTIPDGSFTANPDIAGPGVLAAFFFTAAITIIAVVFGYLTGSLDGDFLNDLDYVAIKGAKVLGNKLRRKSPDIEAPEPSPKSNQARKEAIQQFILALSDQQLVTGLALLVCGVLNQESVSVYENSVLLSLAWFSSTTHLATLDALRTHLKTHGVIKHIRVVGMVCVLTLLSYTFCINIIAMDKKSSTVPVQCLFSDTLGDLPGPTGPPDVIPILALLLVFAGYLVRILDLYSEYGPSSYLYATLEYILIHRRPGPNQEYSSLMAEHQAASLVRSLKTIGKFRTKIPKYSKLLEALYAYDASFLSSLQSIAFSFTYGICQVANYRVVLAPDLSAASNYMGFGQMMAVFLLLLPFLSAGETYYDYMAIQFSSSSQEPSRRGDSDDAPQPDPNPRRLIHADTAGDGSPASLNLAFDRQKARIVSFFPRLVQEIHVQEGQAEPESEHIVAVNDNLVRLKREVLAEYASLKEIEKSIEPRLGLYPFILSLIGSILTAVFLNIAAAKGPASETIRLAAIVLFSLWVGSQFTIFFLATMDTIRFMCEKRHH